MNDYAYQNPTLRLIAAGIDTLGRWLYRPKNRVPHDPQRIVLFRLDQLGDAFYCTPLLDYLAQAYPQAKIDIVTTDRCATVFENHPVVGTLHRYNYPRFARGGRADGWGRLYTLICALRAAKPDICIDPRGEPLVALLSLLSGAPIRVGISHEEIFSFLYTNPVRYNPQDPAWYRFQAELATLGITAKTWAPHIALTNEEKNSAAEEAARIGPYIGLHLGAGLPFKRWPIEYFAQLAHVAQERGLEVVTFGAPGEEELAKKLHAQVPTLRDYTGKLSLRATYALIGHAGAFVGNDSALVHLAGPQGIPAIHLMSTVSPLSAAALGPAVHVLRGATQRHSCKPDTCPYPCPHMQAIQPEAVLQALGWL